MEAPREKCPYSELLWSVFPRILTEYGDTEHNKSEYRHFLRSEALCVGVFSKTF